MADTHVVARADRLRHLETLRAAFAGRASDVAGVAAACRAHQVDAAEAELLTRMPESLARLERLRPDDGTAVREVLETLTSGMVFDLTTFPGEDATALTALRTLENLDHYVYLVAGCVGAFWTALHVAHRPRLAHWNVTEMSAAGVRFGKALQMTNVLRDVPRDLRHGRCYVPAAELATHGLAPADLLDASAMPKLRPVVDTLLAITRDHYRVAWAYTFALPRAEWRTRLACAWPLLIGEATLAALARHPNPLAATTPVKVPRAAVRAMLARSTVAVWSNAALVALAARARRGPNATR